MRIKIIKIAIINLMVIFSFGFNAEAQELSEDQISFTILKWFYNQYENPEETVWKKIKSESGETLFKATFMEDLNKVVAIYTSKGKLVYENHQYSKKKAPAPLIDHAETNFEKFRLLSVFKHTNFKYGARTEKDTNYEMILKVKGEEISIWFGANMNRHKSFDVSKLAVK